MEIRIDLPPADLQFVSKQPRFPPEHQSKHPPRGIFGVFMFAIWKGKIIPIIASVWTNTTKYVTICNFFFISLQSISNLISGSESRMILSGAIPLTSQPGPWYTAAETWGHSRNIEQADYREGKFISPSGLNAQECHVATVYLQQRLAGM